MILSVIIAFIDRDKPLLKDCILSLEKSANGANVKLRFIFVANGTNAPAYILKNKYYVIRVSKNIGFGPAVNRGLKKVKTKWCFIACPDTRCEKSTIKALLPYIKRGLLANKQGDPLFKIAIVGPKVIEPDGKIQPTVVPIPTLKSIFIEQTYLYKLFPSIFPSPLSDPKQYNYAHRTDAVAAIWWLANRDAILRVGGFDERYFLYFEDVDLCKRLGRAGYSIIYVPQARILHLLHQSTGGAASGVLYKESMRIFLEKHYGAFISFLGCCFLILGSIMRLIYWSIKPSVRAKQEIVFYKDVIGI